jgi:hypothetical protein
MPNASGTVANSIEFAFLKQAKRLSVKPFPRCVMGGVYKFTN